MAPTALSAPPTASTAAAAWTARATVPWAPAELLQLLQDRPYSYSSFTAPYTASTSPTYSSSYSCTSTAPITPTVGLLVFLHLLQRLQLLLLIPAVVLKVRDTTVTQSISGIFSWFQVHNAWNVPPDHIPKFHVRNVSIVACRSILVTAWLTKNMC